MGSGDAGHPTDLRNSCHSTLHWEIKSRNGTGSRATYWDHWCARHPAGRVTHRVILILETLWRRQCGLPFTEEETEAAMSPCNLPKSSKQQRALSTHGAWLWVCPPPPLVTDKDGTFYKHPCRHDSLHPETYEVGTISIPLLQLGKQTQKSCSGIGQRLEEWRFLCLV